MGRERKASRGGRAGRDGAPRRRQPPGAPRANGGASRGAARRSVTRHTVELPGRTLRFTATAGALMLTDQQGNPQAEYGYVSYTLDGADPAPGPSPSR